MSDQDTNQCECGGDCDCNNDNGLSLDDLDTEYTPAEQYALLTEDAYKEIVKEKLKQKILKEHPEIDQVVELAYHAGMLRWQEMQQDDYDEEKWENLDKQFSELWNK